MTVGGQGAKLFYLSGVIHGEYQKTEVRIGWHTPVCFVFNTLNFVLVYCPKSDAITHSKPSSV
jgi:hypothetical protein